MSFVAIESPLIYRPSNRSVLQSPLPEFQLRHPMFNSGILRFGRTSLLGFVLALVLASNAGAVNPTPQELQQAQTWMAANFRDSGPRRQIPPFSFIYDGERSNKLLKKWKFAAGPGSQEGMK